MSTRLASGGSGGIGADTAPLYKIARPNHAPARFGFKTQTGESYYLVASVRSDGDYGLRVVAENIAPSFAVVEVVTNIWGQPLDPVHDAQRYRPLPAVSAEEIKPMLSNPTYCDSGPLPTLIMGRSWLHLDRWATDIVFTEKTPSGCDRSEFGTLRAPVSLDLRPDTDRAASPAGLEAKLRLPYNEDPKGLARPTMRNTVVELPEGLLVNPSSADGLEACSAAQVGWKSLARPRCPESSRIATVEVITPALAEPLIGAVYIAEQYNNPLGAFMALYIHVDGQGVQAKVIGEVDRDPVTGKLTARFKDNPQVPFTDMKLRFKSGSRAPLATPAVCGRYESTSTITPWSAPHTGPPVVSRSGFSVSRGPAGAPCAPAGFAPGFASGTTVPTAGAATAFAMNISRQDGEQELKGITQVKLPDGLVGDVGSVALCTEPQAAVGACGAESRIGHVQVAAGVGSTPLWVPQAGKAPTGVYLTGPYRGAPYGLAIMVPAQAGPFDLGRVVVRSALHVDERTAAITSGVDEARLIDPKGVVTEFGGDLPRILKGIVLNQREIRVIVDRPGFMINPTNCSQQQITTQLNGFEGGFSQVGTSFRASDCASLGFAPRFQARILDRGRRSTLRSWNPRTRFTVVPRPGDANIGGARVALPSSTILDQSNLDTTCTRAQMAAEDCPAGSIVGYAKAWSPILMRPVEGPVYLAANGGVRPLPDIAAVLDGEVRVVLQGEISTLRTGGKARLQNTFRVVPDAPVNRFVLTMRGGRNTGLLVNSTDLCRSNERGVSVFQGQNGRVDRSNLRVGLSFRGCRKVRRQAARRAAKRKAVRKSAVRRIARKAALAREVR